MYEQYVHDDTHVLAPFLRRLFSSFFLCTEVISMDRHMTQTSKYRSDWILKLNPMVIYARLISQYSITRTHHRLYHTKDILFIVHAFIKATMNLSHHMIYRPFWLNRIQFFYLIKNTYSIHISQYQRVNTQLLIDMIEQFLLFPSLFLTFSLSVYACYVW